MNTRALKPSLLAILLALPPATAAERKAPEEFLPSGALFLVKVRDTADLRDILQGKGALLNEPDIKALLGQAEATPENLARKFEEQAGLPLKDLLDVLDGPAALALYPQSQGTDPQGLVAVGVKPGGATEEVWKRVQDRVRERDRDRIVREQEEEIEGVDLWTLTRKSGKDEEKRVSFALHEDLFLAGDSREAFEQAILALRGKEVPTMGGTEEFRAAMRQLGRAQDIVLLLDVAFVQQAAGGRRRDTGAGEGGERIQSVLRGLGLDIARSLALGIGSTDESHEARLYLHAPGKRTGILKLLTPKSAALEPDKFAPPEAVAAGVLHLDPPEILSEVERMVDEIAPDQAGAVQMFLDMIEGQTSVNLKKDLLEQFVPPIYFVQMPGGAPKAGIQPDTTLYYARVRDMKRFEEAVKNLITGGSQGMASLKETEYLGYKVNTVEMDFGGGMMPEGVPIPAPSFVVTDSHFFFCMGGTGPVEEALRSVGKETKLLSASNEYRRAIAGLPETRWFVSFIRVAANLEQVVAQFKALADMMEGMEEAAFGPPRFFRSLAKIDPKLFKRHVELGGMAATSNESGILFAARLTRPAKEGSSGER